MSSKISSSRQSPPNTGVYPSLSASSPSSTVPLQLSSIPLSSSGAPGCIALSFQQSMS